tara:strand:+ start:257 stop:472 length:216 start_codon:yes stop_codon:yes gene_type:complete
MKGIFLYILITITPFQDPDSQEIDIRLQMKDMEACEKAQEDLSMDFGPMFQIMGTKINVDVKCIDTRSDII